jgi:hypothetical protein
MLGYTEEHLAELERSGAFGAAREAHPSGQSR